MARCFNTAHRNDPQRHYTLPPLGRLPADVDDLVHDSFYFVLHAPRQSGKTTCIMALAHKLRLDGRYAVVFCSVESGRTAKTEAEAVGAVVLALQLAADQLSASEAPPVETAEAVAGTSVRLYRFLKAWAAACPRPLVLFIDEIDCLADDGLISVLSQLRKGYAERPAAFPHSVCIFGMRDVRDYKVSSGGSHNLGTSSPFNIKRKSLTLPMFTRADIAELYGQHTAETGQVFTAAAMDRVLQYSGGHPHLVNALANDVVAEQKWPGPVDALQIDAAKERIILQWGTHFDSLMARLREDRVRAVLEPILAGAAMAHFSEEDERYCRDLGLINGRDGDIANAIYREVIPRCLAGNVQRGLRVVTGSWQRADGRLDIAGLRQAFLEFWREHAESFVQQESYREVSAQLVVMGFLQRIVNGGGQIERGYAAGSKRMDILIKWPVADENGNIDLHGTRFERHLFELKVWRAKKGDPRGEGLVQLGEYLQRVPCESASLLIFDRRPEVEARQWEERVAVEIEEPLVQGVPVWVFRG